MQPPAARSALSALPRLAAALALAATAMLAPLAASAFPIIYSSPLNNGVGYGVLDGLSPGAYRVNLWINPAGADPAGIFGAFDVVISAVGVGTTLTGFAPSAIIGGTITASAIVANTLNFQLGNTTGNAWTTPFRLGTLTGTSAFPGSIWTISGTIQDSGFWEVPLEASCIASLGIGCVPEPSTALLVLTGLLGLAARRRRCA